METLLCQAGGQIVAVCRMRSQEGQEIVPVHFDLSVPALGTCSWQGWEHVSLHFHFVAEVFGEGRQGVSLVSIHVYAAIWLLSKDEGGISLEDG